MFYSSTLPQACIEPDTNTELDCFVRLHAHLPWASPQEQTCTVGSGPLWWANAHACSLGCIQTNTLQSSRPLNQVPPPFAKKNNSRILVGLTWPYVYKLPTPWAAVGRPLGGLLGVVACLPLEPFLELIGSVIAGIQFSLAGKEWLGPGLQIANLHSLG